jgi:hypothetical protein
MAFSSAGSAFLRVGRIGLALLLASAGASAVACGSDDGREVRNGAGTGTGSTNGSGGGLDLGDGGSGTGPNGKQYCQEADVSFKPRTPTVFVLVDRSGSIYGLNLWVPLRDGVLPVISDLQEDVRFGFGTFTGTTSTCTGVETPVINADLNNHAAIATHYNGLSTTAPAGKLETPTALAIQQATDLLLADTEAPGDRFILLVTGDADPDFCDDPPPQCGADATIASIQIAHSKGVRTLVFAIEHAGLQYPEWFHYYAQAGLGQQPNWADGLNVGEYSGKLNSECNNDDRPYWREMRTANGNAGFLPAGKYSADGGSAMAFLNDNVDEIAAGIRATVEGLKSCTFDLAASNVEVKEGSESQGEIFVNDELIPADQWRMNNPTTLELLGAACETWQRPEVTKFFAGFPCDAIVVR